SRSTSWKVIAFMSRPVGRDAWPVRSREDKHHGLRPPPLARSLRATRYPAGLPPGRGRGGRRGGPRHRAARHRAVAQAPGRSVPVGRGLGRSRAGRVVRWTRLAGAALEATGAHRGEIPARWEVAEDEGLRRIVRAGTAAARPELGHAVHVEVEGLRADRDYHYRFALGDATTAVGRTRTAPAPDARPARLRFAFASCQHWEHGLYTAYRHMADEDLDLVVHLGDYIYEGGRNPRVRAHEGPELRTLEQYRGRYETYRSDPHLRAVHLRGPWIVTWDDHEVADNYAGSVARDDQSPEALLLRRAAAYQAY